MIVFKWFFNFSSNSVSSPPKQAFVLRDLYAISPDKPAIGLRSPFESKALFHPTPLVVDPLRGLLQIGTGTAELKKDAKASVSKYYFYLFFHTSSLDFFK